MKKSDIAYVCETLARMYPDNKTELVYTTPFQLLLSVIMSAQTTDKQVNKVTAPLYSYIRKPLDVISLGEEAYAQAIKSIGLYISKARNIYKLAHVLADPSYTESMMKVYSADVAVQDVYAHYGYMIPRGISDLMKLPGVGEKTAKVVSHCLYGTAVIAVDTHVHRITNRLGIVKTTTPLQTSKLLEKVIPESYKSTAHHSFILFGRYHCVARKPKCESCPLRDLCKYYAQLRRKNHTHR